MDKNNSYHYKNNDNLAANNDEHFHTKKITENNNVRSKPKLLKSKRRQFIYKSHLINAILTDHGCLPTSDIM